MSDTDTQHQSTPPPPPGLRLFTGQFKLRTGHVGEIKIGARDIGDALVKFVAGLCDGPLAQVDGMHVEEIDPSKIILPESRAKIFPGN